MSRPMRLPDKLRLLVIAQPIDRMAWLEPALRAEGVAELSVAATADLAEAARQLREVPFDAVLIEHQTSAHVPTLDGLSLTDALRAAGHEMPVLLLGEAKPQTMEVLCYESDVDAYCWLHSATARSLLCALGRALHHRWLAKTNRQLQETQQQQIAQQHEETSRLVEEQRALISTLEGQRPIAACATDDASSTGPIATSQSVAITPSQTEAYLAALRLSVFTAAGSSTDAPQSERRKLAADFVTAGYAAEQLMRLHLQTLEGLLEGLGERSSRHVIARAEAFLTEMLSYLADGYRERYHGVSQETLPPHAA